MAESGTTFENELGDKQVDFVLAWEMKTEDPEWEAAERKRQIFQVSGKFQKAYRENAIVKLSVCMTESGGLSFCMWISRKSFGGDWDETSVALVIVSLSTGCLFSPWGNPPQQLISFIGGRSPAASWDVLGRSQLVPQEK